MNRNLVRIALSACLLGALAVSSVMAQPGGMGMGPGASAPGTGMQHGMRGWRMNRDNTPGWSMMSRAERDEHHRTMMAQTDYAQCHATMEQHHAKMTERAKERGQAMPGQPRHDACAGLKKP